MDIQVGNKTLDVTLVAKEGNNVKVDIDGQIYDVDVVQLLDGTYSIIKDGTSYNVELWRGEGGKHYRTSVNYSTYQIDMLDSQAKYMRMRRNAASEDAQQEDCIKAPMPCKIVRIYCKPGDVLHAGDTALTMEAMKMQSNCKVSADCTVEQVLVSEGESIRVDQPMIKLNIHPKNTENHANQQ